jgi:hypothetical protein
VNVRDLPLQSSVIVRDKNVETKRHFVTTELICESAMHDSTFELKSPGLHHICPDSRGIRGTCDIERPITIKGDMSLNINLTVLPSVFTVNFTRGT